MIFNPIKTHVLPISCSEITLSQMPVIQLGNTVLQYVNKVKYLGFYVNSSLTCKDHINNLVKKVYFVLRNLRMTSNCIPSETKRRLVIQLILPLINYFADVYSKLDSQSYHKVLLSLNSATRYVFGISRFSSVSTWRKMILGCELEDYLRVRNLLFLHKLLNDKTPLYLYDRLTFGRSRNMTLIIPKHTSLNTSRLFFVNAIKLWNALPMAIKSITGKNIFKKALLNLINSIN